MESEGGEWNVCVAAPVQRCCAIAVQRSQAKPSLGRRQRWLVGVSRSISRQIRVEKKERKRERKEGKEKQAKKSHSLSE